MTDDRPEPPAVATVRLAGSAPPEPEGAPWLLIVHRDGAETVRLAPGSGLVIGRSAPSDVTIADEGLSRQHARFTWVEGHVLVEDLGSTNGTFVAGRAVDRARVGPEDRVTIGTVSVSLHAHGASWSGHGVASHERLRLVLEQEVERARFFGRPLALVMFQAPREEDHFRGWCARVQKELRPIDRLGVWSSSALAAVLSEPTRAYVLELAKNLTATGLFAGVAMSPENGSSAEELLERARAAAQRATAAAPIQGLAGPDAPPWTPLPVGASGATVAKSPALLATLDMAGRVARSALPVLLQGETGSGKEVVARFLHERGRADRPLVTLNCAAIPDSLVESVLFGHEKGAFTGAARDQKGVFEAADGGTLLLDEIGELPLEAQAALLRVLETKRLMRVGSTREISVDVRIVAATHRDLEAAVLAGRFREDLLFRLAGVAIRVPPLRERPEDLEPLIARFVAVANSANGREVRGVDPEALALLAAYPWPGNVRELHNAIERAVVIASTDLVTLDDLPERIRRTAPATAPIRAAAPPLAAAAPSLEDALASLEGDFRSRMERLEAVLLTEALRDASWNQTETARRLQMPLRTLVHKLKMHGIRRP